MWTAISNALKSFLPLFFQKAVEIVTSKKAVATALTYVGIQQTDDWKKQVATAATGIAYVYVQGKIDHVRVLAAAKLAP